MDRCLAGHNAGLKSDMFSRALRQAREESAISSPSFFLILSPQASFITADIQISGWNTEKPGHGTVASSYLSISRSQPSSVRL
ncbi:uncharacterized [Tachysurus ichikawai]